MTMQGLIKDTHVHTTSMGSQSNFACAHNVVGQAIIEKLLIDVRATVEKCEHLNGIDITHAINGGTGSGMTSLFLT